MTVIVHFAGSSSQQGVEIPFMPDDADQFVTDMKKLARDTQTPTLREYTCRSGTSLYKVLINGAMVAYVEIDKPGQNDSEDLSLLAQTE
jgi:hypothetical protein